MTAIIRRHYLDSQYGQLHYREAAPRQPTARPLVLLHQNPSSSFEYEPLIRAMATDRRVIALDTPGYGNSDGPDAPLSMEGYAEPLAEALPALGLSDGAGCDVYGYHTGALLALEVAIAAPATVRHAVVTGLPMRPSEERAALLEKARNAPPLDEDGTMALGMARDLWAYIVTPRADGVPLPRIARVWVDKLRALDRSSWAYVGVWSYDYDARLPLVTQPVLLAQHAEAIAEYSKAAMRLLADGHVVELSRFHRDLLELPEAIAALAECMRDFLVSRSSKGRNP